MGKLTAHQESVLKFCPRLETINYAHSYLEPDLGVTSRTLDAMELKGFVRRAKGSDRYWLTDKGEAEHKKLNEPVKLSSAGAEMRQKTISRTVGKTSSHG